MDSQAIKDKAEKISQAPLDDRRRLFSELFKEVIVASGASLQDISHQTRISINFLEALESAEFEVLPGEIFGRGFIRNVCKIIAVDPLPLVTSYDACLDLISGSEVKAQKKPSKPKAQAVKAQKTITDAVEVKSVESSPKREESSVSKSSAPKKQNKSMGWVFPVFGVAAAVMVALWPTENEEKVQSNLPFAVKAMKSAAVKRPAEVTTSAAKVITEEQAQSSDTTPQEAANDASVTKSFKAESVVFEQVVEIKVLEPVQIKRTIDDESTQTEDLSQRTYRFVFDKEAEFLIYDAAAVEITFNGRSLGDLGDKGRIRRLSFAKKSENTENL